MRPRRNPFLYGLHRQAWLALAWGIPLAMVIVKWSLLATVLMPLPVIIHEMGHAAAAWLFGRPAIPAFDFHYGGGVTRWFDQIPLLLLAVPALGVYLAWLLRERVGAAAGVVAAVTVYSLLAWTPAHLVAIEAAGHGFELLFAGIFIYRALTGWGLKLAIERPLYAMLGFWFLFHNLAFAHALLTSVQARADYAAAKGGGDWMDFAQLSRDLGVGFPVVVGCYLMACLLTPAVAYMAANLRKVHRVARAEEAHAGVEDEAIGK